MDGNIFEVFVNFCAVRGWALIMEPLGENFFIVTVEVLRETGMPEKLEFEGVSPHDAITLAHSSLQKAENAALKEVENG